MSLYVSKSDNRIDKSSMELYKINMVFENIFVLPEWDILIPYYRSWALIIGGQLFKPKKVLGNRSFRLTTLGGFSENPGIVV